MSKCGFNAAMQNGGKGKKTNKQKGGFWPFSDKTSESSNQSTGTTSTKTTPPENEGFFSKIKKMFSSSDSQPSQLYNPQQSGGRRYKSRKNKRKSYKSKTKTKTKTRKY